MEGTNTKKKKLEENLISTAMNSSFVKDGKSNQHAIFIMPQFSLAIVCNWCASLYIFYKRKLPLV